MLRISSLEEISKQNNENNLECSEKFGWTQRPNILIPKRRWCDVVWRGTQAPISKLGVSRDRQINIGERAIRLPSRWLMGKTICPFWPRDYWGWCLITGGVFEEDRLLKWRLIASKPTYSEGERLVVETHEKGGWGSCVLFRKLPNSRAASWSVCTDFYEP